MEYSIDNIADLLGGLNEADLDALRQTAESLFGTGGTQRHDPKADTGGMDAAMLGKLGRLLQSTQHTQDARAQLIAALKPYLSTARQKRADEAMQMLRMLDVLPLVSDIL